MHDSRVLNFAPASDDSAHGCRPRRMIRTPRFRMNGLDIRCNGQRRAV